MTLPQAQFSKSNFRGSAILQYFLSEPKHTKGQPSEPTYTKIGKLSGQVQSVVKLKSRNIWPSMENYIKPKHCQ